MWTNCNMWDAVPQIQIDIKGETLSHLFEIGILGTCPQNLIIIQNYGKRNNKDFG